MKLYSLNQWKQLAKEMKNNVIENALAAVYAAKTIQQRFDALCHLKLVCDNHPNDTFKPIVHELSVQATQFAMVIVNANDERDLALKIQKRNHYKKIDPTYMPWVIPASWFDVSMPRQIADQKNAVAPASRLKYAAQRVIQHQRNTVKQRYAYFNPAYHNEGNNNPSHPFGNVTYLTAEQREAHRIFVHQGQLLHLRMQENSLALHAFDSSHHQNFNGDYFVAQVRMIFVVSVRGDIFAGHCRPHRFHHSSFMGREPLFFAGSFIVREGYIQELDDNSGHFTPGLRHTVQTLAFFRKQGLLNQVPGYQTYAKDKGKKEEHNKLLSGRRLRVNEHLVPIRLFDTDPFKRHLLNILNESYQYLLAKKEARVFGLQAFIKQLEMSKAALEKSRDIYTISQAMVECLENLESLRKKYQYMPPSLETRMITLSNMMQCYQNLVPYPKVSAVDLNTIKSKL